METITLQEATAKDLSNILTLYRALEADPHQVLSVDQAQKIFSRMEIYPFYKIYMALYENQCIGTYALLIMDNLAHSGASSGIVEDVVVDPNWRGRGVGKKMMHYAMELCREAGCYKLVLSSNIKRTQAHSFYEALGFQQHGYSFQITFES